LIHVPARKEQSKISFSPTEEQSAHDFAGNLGAIFELMSQELDQNSHNKIFLGEATGRTSAKKYFLAWHCQ
jgi:hypothetical protein